MDYADRIIIEPGKRGGRPCVRGLRITVDDVLGWLAEGMSEDDILRDHPDLTRDDIRACLAFAADRERRRKVAVSRLGKFSKGQSLGGLSWKKLRDEGRE